MQTNGSFEKVPYNQPDFPIYIAKGLIPRLLPHRQHDNWHSDIEFVKVLSGVICYNVNGKVMRLKAGEGLFINSRQIHYNFPEDDKKCEFICIAFQPVDLCHSKLIDEKYILPIITNPSLPCYAFNHNTDWEIHILEALEKIYHSKSDRCFTLTLHSLFFEIWAEMYKHLGKDMKVTASHKHEMGTLKEMICFIQLHFKEKISLYDIALSGNICKTSCYTIFKKYTGRTPVEYLNYHRLRKSIELIRNTDMTLTEICYESGFSGASYFAETFKKTFGCTPNEYRKKNSEKNGR